MKRSQTCALCLGILVGLYPPAPSAARPDVTLWVVQPPGEVVAFELSDFSRVGGVRIPPEAFDDPGKLIINGAGQILAELAVEHLWLWDGMSARMLPVAPESPDTVAKSGRTPPPLYQWLLGDDGASLFVLEGSSRQQVDPESDTVTTALRVRATDFSQRMREQVFASQVMPCRDHALLSDLRVPCPDPELWAPGGVVRDFFVLFRCEQDGWLAQHRDELPTAACHRELWVRSIRGWQASVIDHWGDLPLLDAGTTGSSWVQADEDGGCCGWENKSSNRTIFANADTSVVLFDEWTRLHNQNYDVSFFTSSAKIAPSGRRVAYTIHATSGATATIRESANGHPDSLELAAIRRSLSDLPLVEVDAMQPGPVPLLQLPHAELVGWASDSEVVVVQNRHLVAIDVATKQRRESGVEVRTAADASLVWR